MRSKKKSLQKYLNLLPIVTTMVLWYLQDYVLLAKELPHMFSFENKAKDGSSQFSGFSRVKNLYITGHANGAITFWDVSSPAFIPIISLKQQVTPFFILNLLLYHLFYFSVSHLSFCLFWILQSEDDLSLSGIAITALFFDVNSRLLVSGDQSGTVKFSFLDIIMLLL